MLSFHADTLYSQGKEMYLDVTGVPECDKEMLGPGISSEMTWYSSGEVQHDLLEAPSDNSPPKSDCDLL